ncbi:MAG: transcription antitermination factor NusB [Thermacetogeniaceae bacterium]
MSRRRAREMAMQVLFQVDVGKARPESALVYTLNECRATGATADFTRTLVAGTLEHQQQIDDYLTQYATDWDLPRMANVDRNILRLSLFEMLYYPTTPVNVAIDEALELAKTFSHKDAPRFINGILGRIAKEVAAESG